MSESQSPFDARRPRLLDLFCGAGGASLGYHDAGFEVVGVDIKPQPNYPFEFIQAEALDTLGRFMRTSRLLHSARFDAIHASPPCQAYSSMTKCRPGLSLEYPDLIGPTRHLLEQSGLPWVIENVPYAPMRADVTLCGQMFGLPLYRHRLFEANFPIVQPDHPEHLIPASKAGHWKPGTIISVSGHVAPISVARMAMGIDWMNRDELSEAIPPAYTEFVGQQMKVEMWRAAVQEREEAVA
jgi:DNA (cytosine-5)-methyltransferase 1